MRWRGVLPWCARARSSAIDVSSLARRRRAAPDCAARARNCNIPGACASVRLCALQRERASPLPRAAVRRDRTPTAAMGPCSSAPVSSALSWPVGKIVKKESYYRSTAKRILLLAPIIQTNT